MEPNTKKYLIGGAVLVGGYLVYLRAKHNAKAEKEASKKSTKTPAALPAASTSGQFAPVGLPPSTGYNPYPVAPSYIPPGPGYIPPSYPGQYPYAPPVTGYPYQPPYVPPVSYPGSQAACSSVIGLASSVAIQRLQGLGIYAQVVSVNGIPQRTTTLATGGPSASLYVSYGRVVNAVCNPGAAYNTPASLYSNPSGYNY